MAHYKRRKARIRARTCLGSETSKRARYGMKPVRIRNVWMTIDPFSQEWKELWASRTRRYYQWLGTSPRWHDILFHTRPKRREIRRLERAVMMDWVDNEDLAWPLGSRRPMKYYW